MQAKDILINFYPRPPRGGRRWTAPRPPQRWKISIHALREEGDCTQFLYTMMPHPFLSTPSARRATEPNCADIWTAKYFYPRPPRGGRQSAAGMARTSYAFLSTPSARRATMAMRKDEIPDNISIHALREEGDRCTGCLISSTSNFYPRPPRGGRLGHVL